MNIHTHTHTHEHEHGTEAGREASTMLAYLLDHHRHHTAEISELADSFDEHARVCIEEAVRLYACGDEKLAQALEKLD